MAVVFVRGVSLRMGTASALAWSPVLSVALLSVTTGLAIFVSLAVSVIHGVMSETKNLKQAPSSPI